MKKLILLLVVVFATNTLCAQDIVKNKFVLSDGLIEATLYHDNGAVAQTGYYTTDNKLQGEWTSFDLKGNKTAVAQYENGKKVGSWMFYQEKAIKEVIYTNSKIAQVKTWEVTDSRVVSNRR